MAAPRLTTKLYIAAGRSESKTRPPLVAPFDEGLGGTLTPTFVAANDPRRHMTTSPQIAVKSRTRSRCRGTLTNQWRMIDAEPPPATWQVMDGGEWPAGWSS